MLDWILGFFDEDIKLRNDIKKYENLIDWMRIENKYPLTHKEIFTFRDIYFNVEKYLELEEKYHRAKDIKRDDVEFLKSKLGFLKTFYEMKRTLYRYYGAGCGHWKRGYLLFPETCYICNRNFKRFCKDLEGSKIMDEIKRLRREIDGIKFSSLRFLEDFRILSFRGVPLDYGILKMHWYKFNEIKDYQKYDINFIESKLGFFKTFLQLKQQLHQHEKACEHGVSRANLNLSLCPICNSIFNIYCAELQSIKLEQERQRKIKAEQNRLYRYENKLANLTPEEIGKRYERYIGYLYEINGYKVEYNGIKMGKKDDGIDIIATKRRELIIIQCKWYKEDSQIHSNTIRQLNDNLHERMADNPNKKVVARLYSAYDNLDDQARTRLVKTQIEHIVLPYDNEYPKIKCNINDDNGEKIYHLPGVGMYDYIKINVNRGEFYVKTIEEAENLGFRGIKKELKAIHRTRQTQAVKEQNEPSEDDAEMEALINGGE